MLANFHTHTTFCDGKNTPEELVLAALDRGFAAIGFSGHGPTAYDTRYCMKDLEGYIAQVKGLQEKYKGRIQVLLGVEEDAFAPVDRSRFDYIIGSSHYLKVGEEYYPLDSSAQHMYRAVAAMEEDTLAMTRSYFEALCGYLEWRRPDIIGHFDLLTKFDQGERSIFFHDPAYMDLARSYVRRAARTGCVFEVNTGAMARGLRTGPYPCDELLYELKKCDARLILSSDCHDGEKLDFAFAEVTAKLKDMGFVKLVTLTENGFVEYGI